MAKSWTLNPPLQGCIAAILLIDPPRGPRWLLTVGFSTMAVSFLLLAAAFQTGDNSQAVMICLFALVSFSMNFGPNVATYTLPTECYPKEVRKPRFRV